jgi:hypothetical protein
MNKYTESSPSQTWETIAKQIEQRHEPSSDVLVLKKQGDGVTVAFVDEPFAFEAVWEESNGWVPFNEPYVLHQNSQPALRILINVAVISKPNRKTKPTPMYWEMGTDTFKKLVRLREKYGLDDWLYSIERLDDDDAEPGYEILPDGKMDSEMKNHIAVLPRICLATTKGLPNPYDQ